MVMPRTVAAEALDGLAADDPAAIRSRRDLRRVHRVMGTARIVRRAWKDLPLPSRKSGPLQVLELGAGDGTLMLGVARALAPQWSAVELTLLDRQALMDRDTGAQYAQVGWNAMTAVTDVGDWARGSADSLRQHTATSRWDVIVANLFMHHFESAQLAGLLAAIAGRAECFIACEPSRDWRALMGSHLIGVLGVNAVTRNDAVLSVRAGFRGTELTALWPGRGAGWQIREVRAGPFSHCFRAMRMRTD
jgi:hypothetical protein